MEEKAMKVRVKATGDIIDLYDLGYDEFVNKFAKDEIEFINDDAELMDIKDVIDYLEKKTMNERETKYKVGDKVWYRFISHNMRTTIRRIKIDHKGVPLYFCDFYCTTASFKEEDLFATEEELINHLKDNK